MAKQGIIAAVAMFWLSLANAGDDNYVINFDLNMKSPDGEISYTIQLQGIRLRVDKPFQGNDLGEFDYFLTVSNVADGKGKLTIEFYEFESRKKVSDVVSEIVAEVVFTLGNPVVYEGMSDTFGIDLVFSIDQQR